MAMAFGGTSLLERLALRGMRPPTSLRNREKLSGHNAFGTAPCSAIVNAPTPLMANVRQAMTKTFDAPLLVAPKVSEKPTEALVEPDDAAMPVNHKPIRHPRLMKSPHMRKKKQQVPAHLPCSSTAPPAAPEQTSGKRGRPRVQAARGADAPPASTNTADASRASVAVDHPSKSEDAEQLQFLFSSPIRKPTQKRKRKQQPSPRSSTAVEAQSQAVQPPDSSQGPLPEGPRQRKVPRKGKRSSRSPQPRLLATPQRRASSSPQRMARTSSPRALSFNSASETCTICCEDVCGSNAVRLRCNHGWYCTDCMSRHVEARLDTGAVQQTCPECNVELAERDLKRLIPAELMDRLLARSLEQAVAATEDLRPCPTPNCPMRVALEPDESGQFLCTSCKKGSCLRCGVQPYHRRLTCEQYAAAKKGQKHGRDSFLQWMEETGAKQCPSCRMAVTKQDIKHQGTEHSECHKMLCRNCNTRFCFKCLAVLTDSFTCGCTKDKHGFVDPRTGTYVKHLKKKRPRVTSSSGDNGGDDGRADFRDRAGGA